MRTGATSTTVASEALFPVDFDINLQWTRCIRCRKHERRSLRQRLCAECHATAQKRYRETRKLKIQRMKDELNEYRKRYGRIEIDKR